ncbi:MAG TPA: F0F1 ATP synthase subunit A [Bacillota bacterium]
MNTSLILAAAAEGGEEAGHALFHIGPLPVTGAIVAQWLIMAFLLLIFGLAARGLKPVPASRLQTFIELVVDGMLTFVGNLMDERRARRYLVVPASLFLFIIASNYSGLIPFLPHQPWFKPPTSHWGVTAGLAVAVFFYVQYTALRATGGQHYKHWFDPLWLAWLRVPLGVIEEFARPFSLSLRLFANVFAGETLLALLLAVIPYFLPIGIMGLEMITGAVQALIFAMLTTVYLAEASEEHPHH